MTTLLFIILSSYVGILIFGFTKMKTLSIYETVPKNTFSIVVPFRNESQNLPLLLETISHLNYPKDQFEVLLVDDDSDEAFELQHYKFNIMLIKNQRKSDSPKKDAIETAIQQAQHDWIITTDADCQVTSNWLQVIDNYIQQSHVKMVASGVCYVPQKGFLFGFQNLDFLSLQGATIGSFGIHEPFMCNGANFAYRKDFFYALNGFEGNESIASGDDVFLLQKAIKKDKKALGFCLHKQSIVQTKSVENWKELFQQRVRWASKSTEYHSFFGKIVAILVFLTNLAWIASLFLFGFEKISLSNLFTFIAIKAIVDYILLKQTALFYESRLSWILPSLGFYSFFNTSVAFYSLFGSYRWKGRSFKK